MVTPAKNLPLQTPHAPQLPIALPQYTQQQQQLLNDKLRLYFNTLDSVNGVFVSGNFGENVINPFIAAYDNANQYATANNTPTIAAWSGLSGVNSFTLNSDNTATAQAGSYFKITYSAQLANTDNTAHNAIFWLRVNGVDVPNSSTIFTVPARRSAGVPSFVCGYSEVVFQIDAGDSVGLWWGTDQAANSSGSTAGVYIFYQGAQTTPMAYPAVPSVIGSIVFLSAS
jgi:hypothetical protein